MFAVVLLVPARSQDTTTEQADVVIVGAGYTGLNAALELAEAGYDPAYGARPLKRLLQTAVADPLALKVLDGELTEGSTVTIGADAHGLTFA